MLYLTAALNGKKYNRDIVSSHELIDLFGIKDVFEVETVCFRVPQDQVRPNRDNEGVFDFKRLMIKNRINGVYQGQSVAVEYTPYAVVADEKGNLNIRKSIIYNIQDPMWYSFTDSDNLEKTLMMYLSPENKNSPIRQASNDVYFETYSPEIEAKIANAALDAELDFLLELKQAIKDDILAVKQKAKGLEANLSIANIDKISDDEFQQAFIRKAKDNIKAFKLAWADPATSERGLLQDAIEKNVVEFKSVNGLPTWVWRHSQESLVVVPQGTDARLKLRTYFNDNMSTILPIVQEQLGNGVLDAKTRNKKK